jgi:hypothetical protein
MGKALLAVTLLALWAYNVCTADRLERGVSLLGAGRIDEAIKVLRSEAEATGAAKAWLWLTNAYYRKFDPDSFESTARRGRASRRPSPEYGLQA